MMLKALESLPSRLHSIYTDIVNKMITEKSHQFDITITLFALMLRAARSPTFQEIQVSLAVVQGEDGPDLEEALIDVEYILDCCTDLVVGNLEARTLSFSHPTVRSFLLGLDAVKQRFIPVSTLNDLFPGLFDPARSMRNEDARYHGVADTEDGESVYGSEVFSQFTRDETLVPSLRLGEPGKGIPMAPSKGKSVSEQLVKLFVADPALPDLVASAVQKVGATGFERTFSFLLKQYAKNLEATASKPSQKVAAVWTGHATRRTSSLLRATVRPEDTEDEKLREAIVEFNMSKDSAVNKWLAAQDIGLNPGRKQPVTSRSETAEPLASVQLINDEKDDLFDKSDDEDLSETYTNLDAVKAFMTGSEPYMELKLGLIEQTHPEPHNDKLLIQDRRNHSVTDQSAEPRQGQNRILKAWVWAKGRLKIIISLCISVCGLYYSLGTKHILYTGTFTCGFALMLFILDFYEDQAASSSRKSIDIRAQLATIWVDILNWRASFSNYLHRREHGVTSDLTHFEWTCVSFSVNSLDSELQRF